MSSWLLGPLTHSLVIDLLCPVRIDLLGLTEMKRGKDNKAVV